MLPVVPQYVKWSKSPCVFNRNDHPAIIPKECYALVVSPRIDGYDFSKCLMDGGASLNIMYLETMEKMNRTRENLEHNTVEFHVWFWEKRETLWDALSSLLPSVMLIITMRR